MTEEQPPLIENTSQPTLKARFKFIGILCIAIAMLWVVVTFIIPNPFAAPPVKMRTESTKSEGNTGEGKKPDTKSEMAQEMPAPQEEQLSDSLVSEALTSALRKAEAESANVDPIEKTPQPESSAANPTPTPAPKPAIEIPEMQNDDVMIRQLQQLTETVSSKEQKIMQLRCALDIQSHAAQPDLLGNDIKQCYALLLEAGVSQGDIRTLLEAAMQSGIPEKAATIKAFHASIAPALRAQSEEHTEESAWYTNMRKQISDSFTIRKTGWQEGESVEAIIGRAEVLLNQSNINEAFNQIHQLPDTAKKHFGTWLKMIEIQRTHARCIEALLRAADKKTMEQPHGN
jgi:hypothetical protein